MIRNPRTWKSDTKISVAALVVSLAAIVLSQFHPLYTYLDKPRLDAELSKLQFSETWGKISFAAFVELSNDGRAPGRISRVDVLIKREDGSFHPLVLSVQAYYPIPPVISMNSFATQVPWSPVMVAPDGNWSYWVNCFGSSSDTETVAIDDLAAQTQSQLFAAGAPTNPGAPKSVDDALFQKLSALTRKNMAGFSSGRYVALAEFWGDSRKTPLILKAYSFSVPSAYDRLFTAAINQMKFGAGVVFAPQSPQGPMVTLDPITDGHVVEALQKEISPYSTSGTS